jgi:hypothetical protein
MSKLTLMRLTWLPFCLLFQIPISLVTFLVTTLIIHPIQGGYHRANELRDWVLLTQED